MYAIFLNKIPTSIRINKSNIIYRFFPPQTWNYTPYSRRIELPIKCWRGVWVSEKAPAYKLSVRPLLFYPPSVLKVPEDQFLSERLLLSSEPRGQTEVSTRWVSVVFASPRRRRFSQRHRNKKKKGTKHRLLQKCRRLKSFWEHEGVSGGSKWQMKFKPVLLLSELVVGRTQWARGVTGPGVFLPACWALMRKVKLKKHRQAHNNTACQHNPRFWTLTLCSCCGSSFLCNERMWQAIIPSKYKSNVQSQPSALTSATARSSNCHAGVHVVSKACSYL